MLAKLVANEFPGVPQADKFLGFAKKRTNLHATVCGLFAENKTKIKEKPA